MDAPRPVPFVLLILLVVVGLVCLCPAQEAKDPYEAPALATKTPWVAVVYVAVFAAGICAVAFKNSKRTHLD